MCARARPLRLALVAAALLAAGTTAAGEPGPAAPPTATAGPKARPRAAGRASARTPHPATRGEQDCAACHRERTPEAFQAWERSRHGLALVKCVACHGSPDGGFVRRAAAERCRGCHGVQVDSVRSLGLKDCFACHAPHTLSPDPHRR